MTPGRSHLTVELDVYDSDFSDMLILKCLLHIMTIACHLRRFRLAQIWFVQLPGHIVFHLIAVNYYLQSFNDFMI
jgi:hypothetical protein